MAFLLAFEPFLGRVVERRKRSFYVEIGRANWQLPVCWGRILLIEKLSHHNLDRGGEGGEPAQRPDCVSVVVSVGGCDLR